MKWLCLLAALALAGCSGHTPGRIESRTAYAIKHHVTVRGGGDRNPLPATEEDIEQGRRNFVGYCSTCHGEDGHATGVIFASRMSPPVPDLAGADVQAYSDAQLKRIIENGMFPSGMPAAKGIYTDEQLWQIVTFIRHLPAPSGPKT